MDSAWIGLIGTIIAAMIGAFVNEKYKRHCDAVATAALLAGELSSYLDAFAILDKALPILIEQIERGQPFAAPPAEMPKDIAFEASADKMGLLGPKLAKDISLVYGQIRGFRAIFFGLSNDPSKFEPPQQIAILRAAHGALQHSQKKGVPLIRVLKRRAYRPFCRTCRSSYKVAKGLWRTLAAAITTAPPNN
jgi:hypothetical protein